MMRDSMSNNLGVRVANERIAFCFEVFSQFFVVFDDAVMNDSDVVPRHMWMRIDLARHTVCRPARVRNTNFSVQRIFVERILQLLNFSYPPRTCDIAVVKDSNSSRIVAAILQPSEPVHQDRDNISFGHRADNSTHGLFLLSNSSW